MIFDEPTDDDGAFFHDYPPFCRGGTKLARLLFAGYWPCHGSYWTWGVNSVRTEWPGAPWAVARLAGVDTGPRARVLNELSTWCTARAAVGISVGMTSAPLPAMPEPDPSPTRATQVGQVPHVPRTVRVERAQVRQTPVEPAPQVLCGTCRLPITRDELGTWSHIASHGSPATGWLCPYPHLTMASPEPAEPRRRALPTRIPMPPSRRTGAGSHPPDPPQEWPPLTTHDWWQAR